MIRWLIILLLIVGCEEEPKEGICVYFIGQDDTLFSENDSLYLISELDNLITDCKKNYTLNECCYMGLASYENKYNSDTTFCKGGILDVFISSTQFSDTTGIAYPVEEGIITSGSSPEVWMENHKCLGFCADSSSSLLCNP